MDRVAIPRRYVLQIGCKMAGSPNPSQGRASTEWEPQQSEGLGGESSLIYGPVLISAPDCPVRVAAGRVRPSSTISDKIFASGWGATEEEAARRCRFEADETRFAQRLPHDRLLRARADALPGPVLKPPALLMFSDAQYRGRTHATEADRRHRVPARWPAARPLDWIRGDGAPGFPAVWVPARLCFLDYPEDAASGLPPADSNGLAIGSSIDDACCRAFVELVERDATAIWWYNGLCLPRLDPRAVADGLVAAYQSWSRSRGRELRLLRLTLDLPIPVVAAVTCTIDGREPAIGFGADATVRAAARHAVGELAQCEANLRLLDESAARSGTAAFTPGALRLYAWHRETDLSAHQFLKGAGIAEATDEATPLAWRSCLAMAEAHALWPVVVDLTNPSGPPLARVLVPGLRSTKPRFKRGRLFDVPKMMGAKRVDPIAMEAARFPF